MTTPIPVITGAAPNGSLAAIRVATLNSEVVRKLTATNVSANPANFSVSIKKSGGTARANGPMAKTLQAGESIDWYWASGHALGVGDEIDALSSVAAAIEYELTLTAIT